MQTTENDCNVGAHDAVRTTLPATIELPAAEGLPRIPSSTILVPVATPSASIEAHNGEGRAIFHAPREHPESMHTSSSSHRVSFQASMPLDDHFYQAASNEGMDAFNHTARNPRQRQLLPASILSEDPQPRLTPQMPGLPFVVSKSLPVDQANDPVGDHGDHNMGPNALRLPHRSDLTELMNLQELHASSQRCASDDFALSYPHLCLLSSRAPRKHRYKLRSASLDFDSL